MRMEDIDPPREQAGADQLILACLKEHGLHWDDEVLYQSTRHDAYRKALNEIQTRGLSYFCTCNRKRLNSLQGRYDGLCRAQVKVPNEAAAIRLNSALCLTPSEQHIAVQDLIQGKFEEDVLAAGDTVIHRKDGLFAYQLAVSVDDAWQGITRVVRGYDLLETTPKHLLMMRVLNAKAPEYAHIPVIVDNQGRKLSKQNHAEPLAPEHAFQNLRQACRALQLSIPSSAQNIDALLSCAIEAWDLHRLKNQKQIDEAATRLV